MGSAKYEKVTSFFSSTRSSNFSSALYTASVLEPVRRFLSFNFIVAALRPPLLYSPLSTTMGSLPTMITLPLRNSWAIFIGVSTAGEKLGWKSPLVYHVVHEIDNFSCKIRALGEARGPCPGVRLQGLAPRREFCPRRRKSRGGSLTRWSLGPAVPSLEERS